MTLHWCLGMYSSGSTWLYNATFRVAASLEMSPEVVVGFAASAADLNGFGSPGICRILKTHVVDAGGTAWLAEKASAILLSIRDPRDAVASLMLYQRQDFASALIAVEGIGRYCARFAGDRRSLLLRYEAGFTDDPDTIDRIAATYGRTLARAERDRLAAALRRSAIEAEIGQLQASPNAARDEQSGDVIDSVTHWHSHHANRTGEVGRWRWLLTPAQAGEIEWRMRDWMDEFGYRRGIDT